MVAARTHVEHRHLGATQVHRCDDRDVGQVRAAVVGVVQHVDITALHGAGVLADHGLDALAHAAQVHRHVRRVGDQVALGIEQRAAEIEPLLDVDRVGGVLQLQAHLLGDVHEQVVEHLQQHRVGGGACGVGDGAGLAALQHQVVQCGEPRLPAGLDHGGGVLLGNDGRPGNQVAGAQVLAHHQRGVLPAAAGVDRHGAAPRQRARRLHGVARLGRRVASHHGLDRHRFNDQALALHQEGEALAVASFEAGGDGGEHLRRRRRVGTLQRPTHHQRRIAALVAHMNPPVRRDGARTGLLTGQFAPRGRSQRIELRNDLRQGVGRQLQFHRLLADHVLIGQAHAIGAQHAGQRVHEHTRHAQRIGHQAGVLAARAAEALQGIARHVVAARYRNFLDGIGHLLHRDLDETLGHLLGRATGQRGQRGELFAHHLAVQRLVGAMAKDLGEIRRLDLADHDIGVSHGQRAPAPVTRRAGVGPGALRPHAKARTVKGQDRAAARGHGMDAHHRCAHAHAGHLGLELALELARVVRHVGGGAAHVETDHFFDAGQLRCPGHADDAARRAGQDGVLALESVRVGQPAGRLHEEQLDARHLRGHLLHIAAQDRRQVGIDHRGVAAADEFHHRAGLVAGADLREAGLARQARRRLLVRREAVAVHEDHWPRCAGRARRRAPAPAAGPARPAA